MSSLSYNDLCIAAKNGGIRLNQGPGVFDDDVKERLSKEAKKNGHSINWWTDKCDVECVHHDNKTLWYLTCEIQYCHPTYPLIEVLKIGIYLCQFEVPIPK